MIEVNGLHKRFGSLQAVDDVSFKVDKGEIFGFIGPNGAGKSTTMRMIAGLTKPDSGTAVVAGYDVRSNLHEIRSKLGYMPDFLGVYDDLTVDEYLQFFAAAYGLDRTRRKRVVGEVLELTDLTEKRMAMVDSLSRGMQQRLGVARVLVHEPDVLLLDEPASGLDPRARIELRVLMQELARMGRTLVISSHILSELQEMCTSVAMIERGKLMYAGPIADALSASSVSVLVRIEEAESVDCEALAAALREIDGVELATVDGWTIGVEIQRTLAHHALFESIIAGGARVERFEPRTARLEDAFLTLTKGAVQ